VPSARRFRDHPGFDRAGFDRAGFDRASYERASYERAVAERARVRAGRVTRPAAWRRFVGGLRRHSSCLPSGKIQRDTVIVIVP
jgi:hypothetical protein